MYRQLFEMRLDRVRAVLDDLDGDGDGKVDGDTSGSRGIRRELVNAERDKLNELYREAKISDEIRRSIALTLDLNDRQREP